MENAKKDRLCQKWRTSTQYFLGFLSFVNKANRRVVAVSRIEENVDMPFETSTNCVRDSLVTSNVYYHWGVNNPLKKDQNRSVEWH